MSRRQVLPAAPLGLVTLAEALTPYPVLSKKTLRALIAHGKLPASKVGKYLFVAQADVDDLFRPKVRQQPGAADPAPSVPRGRLSPCPSCSRLSTAEHQELCGK